MHRSQLDRYKDDSAWALITGASDGIGKGFAEELLHHGFNVVLHGRNEKKLEGVKAELLKQWPGREIRILVLDVEEACDKPERLTAALQQLQDIKLRILINNVGGPSTKPMFVPFQEHTAKRTRQFLDMNAGFLTEITRQLLPQLISNSPGLIINIGSFASEIPCPYVSLMGATKLFNKSWSRSLSFEFKILGHDIEVMHILVGGVQSGYANHREVSFLIPSSRQLAKGTLEKVGCGRSAVAGYWPHDLQFWLMTATPAFVRDRLLMSILKREREIEQRQMKEQ